MCVRVCGNVCAVCVVGGESRARVQTCLAVLHLVLMLSTYVCHVRLVRLPAACLPIHPVCAIGRSQARPADAAPVPLVARQALLAKLSPLAG